MLCECRTVVQKTHHAFHLSQLHVISHVRLVNELKEPLLRVEVGERPWLRSVCSHKEAVWPVSLRWKQRGCCTPA